MERGENLDYNLIYTKTSQLVVIRGKWRRSFEWEIPFPARPLFLTSMRLYVMSPLKTKDLNSIYKCILYAGFEWVPCVFITPLFFCILYILNLLPTFYLCEITMQQLCNSSVQEQIQITFAGSIEPINTEQLLPKYIAILYARAHSWRAGFSHSLYFTVVLYFWGKASSCNNCYGNLIRMRILTHFQSNRGAQSLW